MLTNTSNKTAVPQRFVAINISNPVWLNLFTDPPAETP